ncbi:endonuclease domain-containing protein [Sandaracinobacteroides saxicola]|uniref:Endonuclease domain-containing protein n=1 Tax=Sandaracinobacteroides saxicola TaxID=2759707 RepID=A0A7G5IMU3_9SPHN|nr:endonuclease domain-containing protein [Sandaracinobacteroides saxicola]
MAGGDAPSISPPLQGRGRGWGLSAERRAEIQKYARDNRNNATAAERRLWKYLSRAQLGGYKFRRQAAIGTAIADFLCPQKALILEVDGATHVDPDADARRDQRLATLGFVVHRVTNEDVLTRLDDVLRGLWLLLESLPDRWPSRATPPHPYPSPEGEGKRVATTHLPFHSREGPGVGTSQIIAGTSG